MRRLLTILASCILCTAASGLTTVTDTLYDARGKLVSGRITIKWDAFTVPGPRTVAAGQVIVAVKNGAFTVELEPGDTAQPAAVDYTAEYRLSDGMLKYERWRVPTSATPVTISAVRLSTVQTPATMLALTQLSPVGAAKGDLIAFGTSWGLLSGGSDGQALLKDSSQSRGLRWGTVEAGVSSVFGRTGAVSAQSGDYAVGDVTGLTDALAGKSDTGHGHAQSDVTGLVDDLAGKAATDHQHTMFSAAGVGHIWLWGKPGSDSIGEPRALGANNRVLYSEFCLPAGATLRTVYLYLASGASGKYLAVGIWNASGQLVATSATVSAASSYTVVAVPFQSDVALTTGCYFFGWTSDWGAVSIAHDGTAMSSAGLGRELLDGIYSLAGAASLRYNFRDGTSSAGTTTLTMPANMGPASSRLPMGTGPYDYRVPLILGMP